MHNEWTTLCPAEKYKYMTLTLLVNAKAMQIVDFSFVKSISHLHRDSKHHLRTPAKDS